MNQHSDSRHAKSSPGARFREALATEKPLQVAGVVNALTARMAERAGYRAICLSGSAVANVSCGLPDLGLITLSEVLADVDRIVAACGLPLLVDVDTGFGGSLMVARTTTELIRHGAAAMHIEDQVSLKRCGHRPGKELVSTAEMLLRLKAAVDARNDESFVIVARTDAVAVEGLDAAVQRACEYAAAGADVIFAEACTSLEQYEAFAKVVGRPILANLTEFSMTPSFSVSELAAAGVGAINYPMAACRAMNAAAMNVYESIRREGSAVTVLNGMQTRKELYELLDYDRYEAQANDARI